MEIEPKLKATQLTKAAYAFCTPLSCLKQQGYKILNSINNIDKTKKLLKTIIHLNPFAFYFLNFHRGNLKKNLKFILSC